MSDALVIALFVGLAAVLAYQVYMLVWTKKTAGSVPRAVIVLRAVNIVLLLGGGILIAISLLRG